MNTRKFLLAIVALGAMVICSSSCKKESKPKEEAATASFTIDPSINEDFKSTCCINFSCVIKDQNGTTKHEGVLTAAKEFKDIACPCTISIEYTYGYLKGKDIDTSKSYSLEYGPTYKISTSKSTSTEIGGVMYASIKGSELSDWVTLLNTADRKDVYTIDKTGKITLSE